MAESRYKFDEKIGEGGLGSVYKAWDQRVGRWVAIKRLKRDSQLEDRITREVGLLASLQHPNIVTILDYWVDDEGACVVMELISGPTLDEECEKGPLPLAVFLQFADEICRALSAAHSQGIYHRDLKPGNIMLHDFGDKTFTVKLVDFGMALAAGEAGNQDDEVPVGSPLTVAPEQINGEPVDARTDIYSLGCVFYNALTGHYPYESSNISELLDAHLNRRPPPLKQYRTDVPSLLSTVIGKMMARLPENRYQTIEEVRAAIRSAVQPRRGATGMVEGTAVPVVARKSPVGGAKIEPRLDKHSEPRDLTGVYAAAVVLVLVFGALLVFNPSLRQSLLPGGASDPEGRAAPAQVRGDAAAGDRVRLADTDYMSLLNRVDQDLVLEGRIHEIEFGGDEGDLVVVLSGLPRGRIRVQVGGGASDYGRLERLIGSPVAISGRLQFVDGAFSMRVAPDAIRPAN